MHAGDMEFDMAAKNITLFARKVAPKLKDLGTARKHFGPLAKRRVQAA
jgi:hypothetical protein